MQIVSAYLLAASAVDSGNYDEDYEVDIYDDFAEYMELGGDDIVGDYIDFSVPTGGSESGAFSGDQFCGDWLSTFIHPTEYAQIYYEKMQISNPSMVDPNNESQWTGFKYNNQFVPSYLDNIVYQNTGKHINTWMGRVTPNVSMGESSTGYGLTGVYMPKTAMFLCTGNYPVYGYATFKIDSNSDIYVINVNGKNEVRSGYGNISPTSWDTNGVMDSYKPFLMVYSVKNFTNYLNSLDATRVREVISQGNFILADCNVSKSKA